MHHQHYAGPREGVERLLDDASGRPFVFGVCRTLADRARWPAWAVRLGAVVLLLFLPWLTAIAYVVTALAMPSTRPRTLRLLAEGWFFVRRWARRLRRWAERERQRA